MQRIEHASTKQARPHQLKEKKEFLLLMPCPQVRLIPRAGSHCHRRVQQRAVSCVRDTGSQV
eukprot:6210595-Pleurochrysis_carterae.AAC.2